MATTYRRGNRCYRRRLNDYITPTELPSEILMFHILPKLPAKSILRFKTVSKQWNSFLKMSIFTNMHLHHVTNDHHNHHKLIVLLTSTTQWEYNLCDFTTIDIKGQDGGVRLLPFEAIRENLFFLTSCNGLVCVGVKDSSNAKAYACLGLWNPLTGEFKTLFVDNYPLECYHMKGRAVGLYYSSCDDDYRLLRVTESCNVYIYSLKSDSWRKVESVENSRVILGWDLNGLMSSALLNENLYYFKLYKGENLLLKFDTKTEKFSEIKTPTVENQINAECLRFVVQRACIYVCMKYDILKENSTETCIELWRMNEDGDWTNCPKTRLPLFLQPVHLINDGNWIMSSYCSRSWLKRDDHEGYHYHVDPEKHIKDNDHSFNNFWTNIPGEGKYIETFESPNRYMKLTMKFEAGALS